VRRSYQQQCGLALSLDVIGERWALLLLRELLAGPCRYNQLARALPGIGTNLLAQRLKDLEADGLIRRADGRYQLTELGMELEPALLALARFGLLIAARHDDEPGSAPFRASWGMLALRSLLDPSAGAGIHDTYEFHVDDAVFHLVVDDGTVSVGEGPAGDPDLVVHTDAGSFFKIGTGLVSPLAALVEGRVRAEGAAAAFARCARVLGLDGPQPPQPPEGAQRLMSSTASSGTSRSGTRPEPGSPSTRR
jgi:DNA-binding HxlR family transcriptional regulator